jgi:hypothetical protein
VRFEFESGTVRLFYPYPLFRLENRVWPKNHSDGFLRFGLKIGGDGFCRFGLKIYCDGFWQFGLKTCCDGSPSLASKEVVSFLVEPQNQGGGGFPGLGLKISSFSLVIWALKSL